MMVAVDDDRHPLERWQWDLLRALTDAAYAPGGLDWLGRVARRYRRMFGAPILGSIEAMVEVWQGN